MSRKIGVSVVSMFPWSLGKFGLLKAASIANKTDFDGIQVLPLRGWNSFIFTSSFACSIISFEGYWNCGSFFGAIARHLKLAGEENPLLQDWILFGSCQDAEKRNEIMYRELKNNSLCVTHNAMEFGLLEMHPELRVKINFYADHPFGLVWDTQHVLRPGRHGEPPVSSNWRKLLDKVRYNIRLIHVKSSADPKMLKALSSETECPVILEDKLPLGSIFSPAIRHAQKRMIEWLKSRRLYLSYFFD